MVPVECDVLASVCVDVLLEDAANYTCQIDGPLNTVIGQVTHSVLVNGLIVLR